MSGDEPKATLFSFHAARGRPARSARRQRPPTEPIAATLNLFDAVEPPPDAGHADAAHADTLPAETLAAPPARPRHLYRVRELIAELRVHVEGAYTAALHVEGELSNVRPAASGHLYFTLKDGDAQLPVVLFRRHAQALTFRPADGMAVEVRGHLSLYETRGQLQLIAENVRPRGIGALQLAFEQMRDRLRAEGLFDRERKPLPAFPHCLGVVTSPTGAALYDIIQVIRRRHARLNLLVYPAVVQGAQCPASVAAGIRWFNRHAERVDLILVARGGGSLEDLAGFNEEIVARAIVASALPVVSAIGHEVDSTIADFVADLRAPTPSAAAELITAAQHRIEERVAALERRVERAGAYHLMRARQRLSRLSATQVLARVHDSIGRRQQRVDELRFRLETAGERRLRPTHQRLAALATRLAGQDPRRRATEARSRHTAVALRLGRLGPGLVQARALALQQASIRLAHGAWRVAALVEARLDRAHTRLHALSPVAVLSRGYAIVYAADGTILRTASHAAPGTEIHARLGQGSLRAVVLEQNSQETTNS